ncbi:MAG: holo-ACP synthase [Deltaproteobacteria bacterium]|nr:holo-ACP synthase [Deltaproteobacteria bacterium]
MIIGLGVDLVAVDRIAHLIDRWGDRFLGRIFTDAERAYCHRFRNAPERYAARWAAKEAFTKAMGGANGVDWREVEIAESVSGAPVLVTTGKGTAVLERLGVVRRHLTLTHTLGLAVAVVILES